MEEAISDSFDGVRLLNRYILSRFATTFFLIVVVVTFVMCLGAVFRFTDLLARGVSARPMLVVFLAGLPMAMAFSIPISCITSSLLVFEQLSAEGEVTAMRACGISIWQIISRPVLFAMLMSGLCLYINAELAPACHTMQYRVVQQHRQDLSQSLWEPGRFAQGIPGFTLYVGRTAYDPATRRHHIQDVIIYDRRTGDAEREIRAGDGTIEISPDGSTLRVVLTDHVRVDPLIPGQPGLGFMDRYEIAVDIGRMGGGEYTKRQPDFTLNDLVESSADAANPPEFRMRMKVDLNQRLVLALSCLMFVMLGIPFGMTTRRTSSTSGIGISLALVFSFYLFTVLVDNIGKRPDLHPDVIMWTPAILSLGGGAIMLRRYR